MEIILLNYKIIILCFAIFNAVVAVWFLFWSNSLIRANGALKKWVSIDKIEQALSSMRDIDEKLLSMRKFLGITSALLAAFFAYLYFNI